MYLSHYGLREPPFTITPHTEFFYDGANRGPTLEALTYAVVHVEGIVKVTGEVGSGKTMLCRVLMERLPAHVETIYLANPSLSADDILYAVGDDLGLDLAGYRPSQVIKALQNALIERHAEDKYVVVLVDEAHAMPPGALEELRLLSNLETSRHKLLRIVLFGQPELNEVLSKGQMRQLKERITHNFTLQPLTQDAIREYLMFRMRAAGYRGPDVFSPGAVRQIATASKGLTRRVNILADKALLAAFLANTHKVEPRHVRIAIQDSEFEPVRPPLRPAALAAGSLAAGIGIGALAWMLLSPGSGPSAVAKAPVSSTVVAAAPTAARIEPPQPAAAPSAPATATPSAPATAPAMATAPATATPGVQVTAASPPAAPPADAAKSAGDVKSGGEGLRFPEPDLKDHRRLTERVAAAKALLASRSGDTVSIQLFMTNDVQPTRMERFLNRAEKMVSLSDIYVCPTRVGDRNNFTVMFGAYDDRQAGLEALAKLPAKYRAEFSPILRTLDEVKDTL